jgi:hypothetical protein
VPREYCSSCAAEVPVDDGTCFFGHQVSGGDDVAPVDDMPEIVGSEDDGLSELAAHQISEPEDDEPTAEADSPEIVEPEDDDLSDDDTTELAAYQIVEPEDDEDDEPTTEAHGLEIIEPEDNGDLDGRVEIDVGGDDDVDVDALEAAIAELEGQGSDDVPDDEEDDFVVRGPDEDETSDLVGSGDWGANDGFDHDVVAEWELDGDDASGAPTDEQAPSNPPLAEQALTEGGMSAHRARGESDIDDLLDQGDFEGGLTWEQDVIIDETPTDDVDDSATDSSIWGEVVGDESTETSDAPATHDEWDLGEFDEPDASSAEEAVDPDIPVEEPTDDPEAAEPTTADAPQEPQEPAFESDPTIDTSSFTAHGKEKKKGLLSRLFG